MLKKICFCLVILLVSNVCLPALAEVAGGDSFVGDAIIESEYRLGPGDQVAANLIVGNNDMSLDYSFVIGPEGKIYFPNIGEINLLGKTIPEAKSIVNLRIKSVYKSRYAFSFRLTSPRKIQIYLGGSEDKPLYVGEKEFVFIYGQVPKTGRFQYLPGKKYSDYISYAGGPRNNAILGWSTITRGDKKISINGYDIIFNGKREKDIVIIPGDVISVPANFFYFSDFSSFANTILLALTLYSTVSR